MKSPTPSEPIVDWGCSCGATINQEGVQQWYYCDKHKPQTDDQSLTLRKLWQRFKFAWGYAYETKKWLAFKDEKGLIDPLKERKK